ncbi:MAG: hypothetical protein M3443_04230 [Actinomycetota bacterium]|nr:hypothetical protein [Actinomycetota bacterium]
MSQTLHPVATHARDLLRSTLYEYVEAAEDVFDVDAPWDVDQIAAVRTIMSDMSHVVRHAVTEHFATETNCTKCDTPWPCPALSGLYDLLTDPTRSFTDLWEERH